jgi:glutamine amidotransferase
VTNPKIVVLDFGSGNIHSVVNAFTQLGAEVELTADRSKALQADGLVIPGVGAFATVMDQLNKVGAPSMVDQRLSSGKSVFGICVGLQVMFDKGNEHGVETEGLGQWPGEVTELESPTLPHIGWNDVSVPSGSKLFEGVSEEQFYFVHSYGAATFALEDETPFEKPKVSWAEYGSRFVAAVENGPLSATQFHPEKSGQAGLTLLNNWLKNL